MTIHAYSPPLWRMGAYEVLADGRLARRSIAPTQELAPATSCPRALLESGAWPTAAWTICSSAAASPPRPAPRSCVSDGATGSILLVARELDPPYHRPPITKGYLGGSETKDDTLIELPERRRGAHPHLA